MTVFLLIPDKRKEIIIPNDPKKIKVNSKNKEKKNNFLI